MTGCRTPSARSFPAQFTGSSVALRSRLAARRISVVRTSECAGSNIYRALTGMKMDGETVQIRETETLPIK